jgi:hypothetical protein
LFIGLDESGDDFLNGSNTSLLLDLVESILDNVDISNVHIHEVLLFFIVVGPFLESQLQQGSWVREFTGGSGCSISRSSSCLALGFLKLCVILLSKLLLKVLNTVLELIFLLFILCFQGKNLIVEFLRHSLSMVRYIIQFESLILNSLHFLRVVVVHTVLVLLLLTHNIDLVTKSLVL